MIIIIINTIRYLLILFIAAYFGERYGSVGWIVGLIIGILFVKSFFYGLNLLVDLANHISDKWKRKDG
jgi:hypothetical protein